MTSTLNFAALGAQAAAPAATPVNDYANKPKAEVWLNVGITLPIVQADGTTQDTFVALPFGLPLDTMEDMVAKGKNADWLNMVAVKNALLAKLKDAGNGLESGGEQVVAGLEIQLKRVGSALAIAPADNPLLAAMNAKFGS